MVNFQIELAALLAGLLTAWPMPALASAPPTLVTALPPALPGWQDLSLDVTLPALASAASLAGLTYLGNGSPLGSSAWLGLTALAAPACLVAYREPSFQLDEFFAATSFGVAGLMAAYGVTRLAWPTSGLEMKIPVMALAQGAGVALGYHGYRLARPTLSNLNKLPETRTDDPLNWDRWKERHRQ